MSTGKFLVAPEGTYGTAPASGWRRLRVLSDGHKAKTSDLTYRGIDSTLDAPGLADTRVVDDGAEGVIEVGGFDVGLGILFKTAFGSASNGLADGASTAHEMVFTTTAQGPPANVSLAAEWYRNRRDGTVDAWTYKGGRVTQLEFGIGIDETLNLKFSMDYTSSTRPNSTPSRSEAVVVPGIVYGWPDATITLTNTEDDSANAECIQNFGLTVPNELDVADKCIKKGTSRHEPMRAGLPEPSGTINWRYQHPRYYDAFKAGTVFSLQAVFEGVDEIEDGILPSLTIDIPAIKFDPNDPEVTVDNPTSQDLPYKVLSNGTDPAITVTYVTADTAY